MANEGPRSLARAVSELTLDTLGHASMSENPGFGGDESGLDTLLLSDEGTTRPTAPTQTFDKHSDLYRALADQLGLGQSTSAVDHRTVEKMLRDVKQLTNSYSSQTDGTAQANPDDTPELDPETLRALLASTRASI